MPVMTLATIQADPTNAVELDMPKRGDNRLLWKVAYCAARYCNELNYILMRAAIDGCYDPPEWSAARAAGEKCPDAHEYNELLSFRANRRAARIAELYLYHFGDPIDLFGFFDELADEVSED